MSTDDVRALAREVALVVRYAQKAENQGAVTMTNSARTLYADCYRELTQEHAGILGIVTGRAAAHVQRLALTFALLAGQDAIGEEHVETAMVLWRYCFDSAQYIFKDAEIDPVAQTILEALKFGPKTQDEIRDLFGRHQPAERIASVLTDLQARRKVTGTKEPTRGRPRTIWSLCRDGN